MLRGAALLWLLGALFMACYATQAAESTKSEAPARVFVNALVSSAPSSELGDAATVYDWLIGSWHVEIRHFGPAGEPTLDLVGEWHFAWVLEGRAVQDVLIAPTRTSRAANTSREGNRYGSTLRVYNRQTKHWDLTWNNPATGNREELHGRKIGADIVQEGTRTSGQRIRWVFTEIKADSCLWYGEAMQDDGRWRREAEFRMRRKG
jgi:hypothetical protein